MSGCPNSSESGCRCPQHDSGLAAHAADPDAYERALASVRGSLRLSVVTLGPTVEVPCTGGMLCGCKRCSAATAARVRRGAEGGGRSSPFKVRRVAA